MRQTSTSQPNGISIHKDHAIVHTVGVDVKILRINKKQMTMGVFRQLTEESIFLADGTLRGIPWGWVNYRWSATNEDTDCYVIYQIGDKLRKSPIPKSDVDTAVLCWMYDGYNDLLLIRKDNKRLYNECKRWLNTICNEYDESNIEDSRRRSGRIYYGEDGESAKEVVEMLVEEGWVAIDHDIYMTFISTDDQTYEDYTSRIERLVVKVKSELDESDAKINSIRRMFWQNVQQIKELDQLFIAV